MSKLTYKASYYALYAMFAIILIVMGIFFFGGDATGDAVIPGVDPEMWQPAQTDALLYLMYVLFGLAVAATIIAAVFQFGAALKDNPAGAESGPGFCSRALPRWCGGSGKSPRPPWRNRGSSALPRRARRRCRPH